MILLVGDVQGCDAALDRLLDKAGFSPSRDRLVMLGDLVNRGPQSLAVLRRMEALGGAASCLLGNHDLSLLAVAQGVKSPHRSDTIGEILRAPDREHWLYWLRQQRLALVECGWLCVHAGVVPQWDVAQTLALAGEVEALLRSDDLARFLPRMYSNQPDCWRDDLEGIERLRLIVNVLTRIRFCDAAGRMDFEVKDGARAAPSGMTPWFEVPGRQTEGQPVAFGHWSTLGLIHRADLLALDTGCVWGGALSAARVDGGRCEVLQVPCGQEQAAGG